MAEEVCDYLFLNLDLEDVTQLNTKRDTCARCFRPETVCICAHLPSKPIPINTHIIILQHPAELKRPLATVPILVNCLPPDKCTVIIGRLFNPDKHSILTECITHKNNTAVLFPHKDAFKLSESTILPVTINYIIALDGTWNQAKRMYKSNSFLQELFHLELNVNHVSEYVIRTQPFDNCVSTVEAISFCIGFIENNLKIPESIMPSLRALCDHQLIFGAKVHISKEKCKSNV